MPQLPTGAHVQFTPYEGFASFVTLAVIVADAPAARVAGGGVAHATVIGAVEVTVTEAVADWVGCVVDTAVIVTGLSGMAVGAVYVAAVPLDV